MASGLLFNVDNPYERATQGIKGASQTFGRMDKEEKKTSTTKQGKTAIGALSSGGGLGLAGMQVGSFIGSKMAIGALAEGATPAAMSAAGAKGGAAGGLWGAGIGAVLGLAAYYLS